MMMVVWWTTKQSVMQNAANRTLDPIQMHWPRANSIDFQVFVVWDTVILTGRKSMFQLIAIVSIDGHRSSFRNGVILVNASKRIFFFGEFEMIF